MRCPKCGYISFDHLANCKNCSRDMSDVRETLNLPDFEPQVPFLLSSLVGEMQGGGAGYQHELSLTQETELELGGLEMPETEEMEETVEMKRMRATIDTEPSNELKLSEIELDNLETMEVSDTADTDTAETAELKLSDLAKASSEGAAPAEEDEEFLGLEFEMDETLAADLDRFEETLAAESDELAAVDGLELDLDEHDLSELAKELEGHLEAEAGGKKKVTIDDASAGQNEMSLEMEED